MCRRPIRPRPAGGWANLNRPKLVLRGHLGGDQIGAISRLAGEIHGRRQPHIFLDRDQRVTVPVDQFGGIGLDRRRQAAGRRNLRDQALGQSEVGADRLAR